jgi:hypothetical protein
MACIAHWRVRAARLGSFSEIEEIDMMSSKWSLAAFVLFVTCVCHGGEGDGKLRINIDDVNKMLGGTVVVNDLVEIRNMGPRPDWKGEYYKSKRGLELQAAIRACQSVDGRGGAFGTTLRMQRER